MNNELLIQLVVLFFWEYLGDWPYPISSLQSQLRLNNPYPFGLQLLFQVTIYMGLRPHLEPKLCPQHECFSLGVAIYYTGIEKQNTRLTTSAKSVASSVDTSANNLELIMIDMNQHDLVPLPMLDQQESDQV